MAEQLPYAPKRGSFMDVLRTLAIIGGAGLSADPRGRPLGQMLTAGGLLMAEAQDNRRKDLVNSLLAQFQAGEADAPETRQALMEGGVWSPGVQGYLSKVQEQRQLEPLKATAASLLAGRSPAPTGGASPLMPPPDATEAGTGLLTREAERVERDRAPALLKRDAGRDRDLWNVTPRELANIAVLSPTAANSIMGMQQLRAAETAREAQAVSEAAKAQKEQAKNQAMSSLLDAVYTPGTPQAEIVEKGRLAQRLGGNSGVIAKLVDPTSALSQKTQDMIATMGGVPRWLDLSSKQSQSIVESAHKQLRREKQSDFINLRRAMIDIKNDEKLGTKASSLINLNTGDQATAEMSWNDLVATGDRWVSMDPSTRRTYQSIIGAEGLLELAEKIGMGGVADEETAAILGVPPGTELPSVWSSVGSPEEQSILTNMARRIGSTLGIRVEAAAQTPRGIQAQIINSLLGAYSGIFIKGPGVDSGQITEHDRQYITQILGMPIPQNLTELADTQEAVQSKFALHKQYLNTLKQRLRGLNSFGGVKAADEGVDLSQGERVIRGEAANQIEAQQQKAEAESREVSPEFKSAIDRFDSGFGELMDTFNREFGGGR